MSNMVFKTLGKTTIIMIHNLMPKKIVAKDTDSSLKDGFLFMVKEKDRIMALQNLGFDPTEAELNHLRKHISAWGGGETVLVENGVMQMEIPQFLAPFVEKIRNIPGCRVAPNLLRIQGDVYICLEYPDALTEEISKAVLEFLTTDHLFEKKLIYSGYNNQGIPYLLKLYKEHGNKLSDFSLITNVWEFDPKTKQSENQGVFTNLGSFLPKCFMDGKKDQLIFKLEKKVITGNATHEIVDPDNNIVEFAISSSFYSDFCNQVLKKYSGPVFMHLLVTENKLITRNIIKAQHQNLFLKGLQAHWSLNPRKHHKNYVDSVINLEEAIKNSEFVQPIGE